MRWNTTRCEVHHYSVKGKEHAFLVRTSWSPRDASTVAAHKKATLYYALHAVDAMWTTLSLQKLFFFSLLIRFEMNAVVIFVPFLLNPRMMIILVGIHRILDGVRTAIVGWTPCAAQLKRYLYTVQSWFLSSLKLLGSEYRKSWPSPRTKRGAIQPIRKFWRIHPFFFVVSPKFRLPHPFSLHCEQTIESPSSKPKCYTPWLWDHNVIWDVCRAADPPLPITAPPCKGLIIKTSFVHISEHPTGTSKSTLLGTLSIFVTHGDGLADLENRCIEPRQSMWRQTEF